MRAVRWLAVLVVLLTTAAYASAAKPAVKPKPKRHHGIHGKVVEVHHSKQNSNTGNFKIHVAHHHLKAPKKSAAAAATKKHHGHIHEFRVSAGTKFVRVVHEANGKTVHHTTQFRELKVGEHVVVHHVHGQPHEATRVAIVSHHHKKASPIKPPLKKKKKKT